MIPGPRPGMTATELRTSVSSLSLDFCDTLPLVLTTDNERALVLAYAQSRALTLHLNALIRLRARGQGGLG